MLRGLGRETAHWGKFADCLRAQGHELELLDLPGVGTENRRKPPLSIDEMVDDIRRRRRTRLPTGLIAISLGGMLALDWSLRYPDEVSHLVLINCSARGISPFWKRLRPGTLRTGIVFALANQYETKERASLQLTTQLHGAALEECAHEWAEIRRLRPIRLPYIVRQLVAASRFRLSGIPRCPTLVVRSLGDRMVHPDCSADLARRLGAEVLTHPSAGHDLPTDEPQWLAEKISEWRNQLHEDG